MEIVRFYRSRYFNRAEKNELETFDFSEEDYLIFLKNCEVEKKNRQKKTEDINEYNLLKKELSNLFCRRIHLKESLIDFKSCLLEIRQILEEMKEGNKDNVIDEAVKCLKSGKSHSAEQIMERILFYSSNQASKVAFLLGCLAEMQSDFQRAMEQFRRAVTFCSDEPRNIHAAGVMATLTGNYIEAGFWLEKLSLILATKDPQGMLNAEILLELASVFQEQGLYKEAEKHYREALKITKEKQGEAYPLIVQVLYNMSSISIAKEKYLDGVGLLKEALRLTLQYYGEKYPVHIHCLIQLKGLYILLGELENAFESVTFALRLSEEMYGSDHPLTAICLNELAMICQNQGKHKLAEKYFKQVLKIWQKEEPPNITLETIVVSMNNLAKLYQLRGNTDEAENIYAKSLKIQGKFMVPELGLLSRTLNNFGKLMEETGCPQKAEPYYQKSLKLAEKEFGPYHPVVIQNLNNLGTLYESQKRYKEAEMFFYRAYNISKKTFSKNHPLIEITANSLERIRDKI
ncbi:MAG: tetratricopeptide repeat protein [Deltaproteobacteria bacterium]|nr:tetratricopeptide repeat protein [Deltaproteobacteria bacterium]